MAANTATPCPCNGRCRSLGGCEECIGQASQKGFARQCSTDIGPSAGFFQAAQAGFVPPPCSGNQGGYQVAWIPVPFQSQPGSCGVFPTPPAGPPGPGSIQVPAHWSLSPAYQPACGVGVASGPSSPGPVQVFMTMPACSMSGESTPPSPSSAAPMQVAFSPAMLNFPCIADSNQAAQLQTEFIHQRSGDSAQSQGLLQAAESGYRQCSKESVQSSSSFQAQPWPLPVAQRQPLSPQGSFDRVAGADSQVTSSFQSMSSSRSDGTSSETQSTLTRIEPDCKVGGRRRRYRRVRGMLRIAESMQQLDGYNPKCIIRAQRLAQLGPDSLDVLGDYLKQYGTVEKLVPVLTTCRFSEETKATSIGYAVMGSPEEAAHVLALSESGDHEVVSGAFIGLKAFSKSGARHTEEADEEFDWGTLSPSEDVMPRHVRRSA